MRPTISIKKILQVIWHMHKEICEPLLGENCLKLTISIISFHLVKILTTKSYFLIFDFFFGRDANQYPVLYPTNNSGVFKSLGDKEFFTQQKITQVICSHLMKAHIVKNSVIHSTLLWHFAHVINLTNIFLHCFIYILFHVLNYFNYTHVQAIT